MTDFDRIVNQIKHEMPDFPAEEHTMDNMPAVTPGEGGAFGLAALLIVTGLAAEFSENVQIACIVGGVLLGIAGVLATARIRTARNLNAASQAEAGVFAVTGEDDE